MVAHRAPVPLAEGVNGVDLVDVVAEPVEKLVAGKPAGSVRVLAQAPADPVVGDQDVEQPEAVRADGDHLVPAVGLGGDGAPGQVAARSMEA